MINSKDVIRLKMPFPNINSKLAVSSHMYVCYTHITNNYGLVKCQTFKNMFYNLQHRIIESKDPTRNPFNHKTLIDCDKLFKLNKIVIPDSLLTTTRRNICNELFNKIDTELKMDGYETKVMDSVMVKSVNPRVNLVEDN